MNLRIIKAFIRLILVALLGAAAGLLVSCGSSGAGLIPSANAGPLREDFEAVAKAAEAGNGDCAKTEAALGKTEEDFLALPATVDRGLHKRLEEGIANLRKQAMAMCEQPASTGTTTSTQTKTTPATGTTSTETNTTPSTSTTQTTTTTTTTPPGSEKTQSPGGGVEAPEEGAGEHGGGEQGAGASREGAGNGASDSGGASPGGGQ